VEATKNCLLEGATNAALDNLMKTMDTNNLMVEPTAIKSLPADDAPPTNITVKSTPTKGSPITLHCFGVGTDHDSVFLRQIADATPGGTYYFVENDSSVGSAFGDALGGILSVVAQSAVVNIVVPPEAAALGVDYVDVYHAHKVKRENGSYSVTVGDFYAEETRDVIFEVKLASPTEGGIEIPHAQVSVAYTDTIQKRPANTGQVLCAMNRPEGSNVSEPNQHVMAQWLRVFATQEMAEAEKMASSNLGAARARIQKALDAIEKTSGVNQTDPLIIQLVAELKQVLEGLATCSAYASGGAHYMQKTMQQHRMQRCSEATHDSASVYRGSKKMKMAETFAWNTKK